VKDVEPRTEPPSSDVHPRIRSTGRDSGDDAGSVRSCSVIGMRVDVTSYEAATNHIMALANRRASAYVCVANVHMTMEAVDDASFRGIVNGAALVVPDGKPLVWAQRLLGAPEAKHVRGADLVRHIARAAANGGIRVGAYGGAPPATSAFIAALQRLAPGLDVTYIHSPPFRPLLDTEVTEEIGRMRASGAQIVFVGLGCPKQERWMAAQHMGSSLVFVGVGAAFDFLAGAIPEAPPWVQRLGMEWLFRLAREPRRLWRRYLEHNPRFVFLFLTQLLREHGARRL